MKYVSVKNLTKTVIPVTLTHKGYCVKAGRCVCDRVTKAPKSVFIGPRASEKLHESALLLPPLSGMKVGKQIAIKKVEVDQEEPSLKIVSANSEPDAVKGAAAAEAAKLKAAENERSVGEDDKSGSVSQDSSDNAKNTSKGKGTSQNRRGRSPKAK